MQNQKVIGDWEEDKKYNRIQTGGDADAGGNNILGMESGWGQF